MKTYITWKDGKEISVIVPADLTRAQWKKITAYVEALKPETTVPPNAETTKKPTTRKETP